MKATAPQKDDKRDLRALARRTDAEPKARLPPSEELYESYNGHVSLDLPPARAGEDSLEDIF